MNTINHVICLKSKNIYNHMEITIESYVKRNAYSYIRFSSAGQIGNDSVRRQTTRTAEFCQKHNLQLNDTRYQDLGVSGWTGKNIRDGAMGDFLHAVKSGKIPKGSVLIVENFDRFSRLKPRIAYQKLADIIEAGVDVVTLEDGKFHTKDTLDDFATLVASFAVMQRANEESNRKSELTGSAWAHKRKMAIAKKEVMTGHGPAWLRIKADKSGFEPIPERVAVVHRIIKLVKEGKGKREIARMLDAEKVPVWGWAKTWRENYIFEIIKSRTLLGELQLCQKKAQKGEVVKGYYPAIVDEATFTAIQPEKRQFTAGPQSDAANLFSGLLHDGYHPEFKMKVSVQNKAADYVYMQSYYQRVDPLYAQRGTGAKWGEGQRPLSAVNFRYRDFEQHFLQHFEEFNFDEVMPEVSPEESTLRGQLEHEKKETDKKLSNLLKLAESGGQESVSIMGRITELETTAKRLAKELAVEVQKEKGRRYAVDSFRGEHKRAMELLTASTREARLALRALFHRIIERIDFFSSGLLGGCGHVPDGLKEYVYPDRVGMPCYCIKLVGSYRIWIWWDGCQVWNEPGAEMPPAVDKLELN